MKENALLLVSVLFLALFLSAGAFAAEALFQPEGFSVRQEGKKPILTWETSGERKSLSLDGVGVEKLHGFPEEIHGRAVGIEFEPFGDESVETRYIASAEGEFRLRADCFARFWRSGAFKSFLVLSPVKGEEQPGEAFMREFPVCRHPSELVEQERVMVRIDDGQEVMPEVTPSDGYGEEFLKFRRALSDFSGRGR